MLKISQKALLNHQKYGGLGFETPDKTTLKQACSILKITRKELFKILWNDLEDFWDILNQDILKIIRSSKEEIGIIGVFNRENGKCVLSSEFQNEFILEFLQKRYQKQYGRFLEILNK